MSWRIAALVLAAWAWSAASISMAGNDGRPNMLWFVVDDMSADFSCYGGRSVATPHVDRLAREGTLFERAFTTALVCSPSRSALITGMYQTAISAQHHRGVRGDV
jgi:arylsulfatase A-like enzyme